MLCLYVCTCCNMTTNTPDDGHCVRLRQSVAGDAAQQCQGGATVVSDYGVEVLAIRQDFCGRTRRELESAHK